MRLIIFMNPNVDPQGAGWNIIQSQTAIGAKSPSQGHNIYVLRCKRAQPFKSAFFEEILHRATPPEGWKSVGKLRYSSQYIFVLGASEQAPLYHIPQLFAPCISNSSYA